MDSENEKIVKNLTDLNKQRLDMEKRMINYIVYLESEVARLQKELTDIKKNYIP